MPKYIIAMGSGDLKLSGDERAFSSSMKKFVARYIQDAHLRKEVFRKIMTHPFLAMSRRDTEERVEKGSRYARCLELLDKLINNLNSGSIQQIIPDSITGQRELDVSKLKQHGVHLLDLPNEHLLLNVERHPNGSKPPFVIQYWLFSIENNQLQMLPYAENHTKIGTKDGWLSQVGNSPWKKMSNCKEESFKKLLKKSLSPKSIKKFDDQFKSIVYGDSIPIIDYIPDEISRCLTALLGINVRQYEERILQERNNRLADKYGELNSPGILLDVESITMVRKKNL